MKRRNYPYSLDVSSRKSICPNCGRRTFVRYVDNETGQYLPGEFGRCDREDKCKLHNKPQRTGKTKYSSPLRRTKQQPGNIDLIPVSEMHKTLTGYTQNTLIQALIQRFGTQEVNKALQRFYIGTGGGKYHGWTIFWQVDQNGCIRTGHIMKYLGLNRTKDEYSQNWAHKNIRDDFRYKQCMFGLEQINGLSMEVPVNVVESEKTAIIATIYFPDEIWLASCSKNGLNEEKLLPLYEHSVHLYPDIDAFHSWSKFAKGIKNINVANWPKFFIENNIGKGDLDENADIADYLLLVDPIYFKNYQPIPEPIIIPAPIIKRETPIYVEGTKDFSAPTLTIEVPEQLDQETSELIDFFNSISLPQNPIRLSQAEIIIDSKKFVNSHIQFIKSQKNNPVFKPYLERLKKFKAMIKN